MPIVANELKYFESSNGNLGGAVGVTEIVDNTLHNLFDLVTTAEAAAGSISYRCIYVKNENATLTLANTVLFIQADTPNTDSSIEIAIGTSVINGSELSIVDENTAPVGPVFTGAVGSDFGPSIGDLPADSTQAIWIKRIIIADSNSALNDTAIISMQGDTA